MAGIPPVTLNSVQTVSASTVKQDFLGKSFTNALTSIDKNYINIEKQINLAIKNDKLSPTQLLALQSGVLKSSLELDITSKVIEKVSSGVKQTMNNQV